jgi:hypothetical protein
MFRLLGFLVGSLTSIMIILLIVGMPKLHLPDEDASQQRYDAALLKLKAKQDEIATVTGKLSEDVARVAETVESELDTLATNTPPTAAASTPPAEQAGDMPAIPDVQAADMPPAAPPDVETLWYSFWNPFRSEIAANGFVSQLERVTGIDYRVVKIRTGVYEVAFAYADDEERRTKLSQISAATGLELPDS